MPKRIGKEVNIFCFKLVGYESGLVNFVCTVFEQSDEMLTLLSIEKTMVERNHIAMPFLKP